MIGIYKIENLINHKIYIGQSIRIERRWTEHCNKNGKSIISKAIQKYGKQNFSFQVIEECEPERLNELEEYYIKKYNSIIPNGYNIIDIIDGESSSYVFLTKEDVSSIIEDIKNDINFSSIAEKYDISIRSIYSINNGSTHYQKEEKYPLRKLQDVTKKYHYCIDCGQEISKGAVRCKKCQGLLSRRVDRPTRDELKNLIRNNTFISIGSLYGVSDNTIRKWCKQDNLPYRVKDIKQYNDIDWAEI